MLVKLFVGNENKFYDRKIEVKIKWREVARTTREWTAKKGHIKKWNDNADGEESVTLEPVILSITSTSKQQTTSYFASVFRIHAVFFLFLSLSLHKNVVI